MKPISAAGTVASASSQASRRSGSEPMRRSRRLADECADQAHPVAPEIAEQRDQRAQVQEDVEREAAHQPALLPAERAMGPAPDARWS